MYKICENCKEKYDLKEKKCPQCGGKLKKQYTEEELKEIQKQNDDMMVIDMFLMYIERIVAGFVVEIDRNQLRVQVDAADHTDIAVENALSLDRIEGIGAALPFEIVVVADLHHAVALAEGNRSEGALGFFAVSRVDKVAQNLV